MDTEQSTDKRHFSRIPFVTNLHLVNATGSWNAQLVDISLNGILAIRPGGWHARIGDRYLVEMLMDNPDAAIRMEVSVAHVEDQQAGFRCEHVDLDSISHLRRLVKLNLGDSEMLNRELTELIHP
jgi:hypothetical protein